MKRILVLSALLVLASPAVADDSGTLIIESGRFGVMMEQSRALLAVLKPGAPSAAPTGDRAVVFENLVGAVLDYNVIAHQACRDRLVGGDLCQGPFTPRWLGGKASNYSDAQLRAMTDETGGRLMPLWTALCDKAPKPPEGQFVCPME